MDIYGLKEDVLGYHYEQKEAAQNATTKSDLYRHVALARLAYRLYEILCAWVGKQPPEEFIEAELSEISPIQQHAMRRIIRDLGYEPERGKLSAEEISKRYREKAARAKRHLTRHTCTEIAELFKHRSFEEARATIEKLLACNREWKRQEPNKETKQMLYGAKMRIYREALKDTQ